MTQEEKELLLKELCTRLPYNVKCYVPTEDKVMTLTGKRLNCLCFHDDKKGSDYSHETEVVIDPLNDANNNYVVKPYLRSMEDITDEEDYDLLCYLKKQVMIALPNIGEYVQEKDTSTYWETKNIARMDWLYSHHFDHRGLIQMNLAIRVTDENNPYK